MKSSAMVFISAAALLLMIVLVIANPEIFRQQPWFVVIAFIVAAWRLISWVMARSQEEEIKTSVTTHQQQMERVVETTGDAATVVVYRIPAFVGKLNPILIYCDESLVASLSNGSFSRLRMPPGQHVFTSEVSATPIPLSLEPGKEYFIRTGFTGLVRRAFEVVPREHAQSETSGLKQASL
jgi:hypothetical protein